MEEREDNDEYDDDDDCNSVSLFAGVRVKRESISCFMFVRFLISSRQESQSHPAIIKMIVTLY